METVGHLMNRLLVAFGCISAAVLLAVIAVRLAPPIRDSAWKQGEGIYVQPGKPVVSPSGNYLLSMVCSDELSAIGKCHFLIRRLPDGTVEELSPVLEFSLDKDF